MRKTVCWPVFVALLLYGLLSVTVQAQTTALSYSYLAPRPGAILVSADTTIAIRPGAPIEADSLDQNLFQVQGSDSGLHTGDVILAHDGRTVIFRPQEPFAPTEQVTVTVQPGLQTSAGDMVAGAVFSFTISPKVPGDHTQNDPKRWLAVEGSAHTVSPDGPTPAPDSGSLRYHTIPDDWPVMTVTVPANGAGDSYIFLSNFTLGAPNTPYALIVANNGEPVYARPGLATDFKVQPNGRLTFYDWNDEFFHALNETYAITDTYQAGNGYQIDFHELLLLPNGNALFMIYDPQPVDMSQITPDGLSTATVIGLVIQETDPQDNVVFEWRSWDHIPIIDTTVPLTSTEIDYVHGNALALDNDGNILLSSRHLSEITKINRDTGEIIWRLGGKHNQFTFIDDPVGPFALQHYIRRLDNGHIVLFDNRAESPSRGVEYALDETNRTATLVWSYSSAPGVHAPIVGNTQRLSNGNTVIGWGSAWPTVTEVKPDGSKAFELTLAWPKMTYRALRYPWHGKPSWPPTLVIDEDKRPALYYSWNGATDILYYRIYGGMTAEASTLIDVQRKNSFEGESDIAEFLDHYCYFRVMPIDSQGNTTQFSNVVFAEQSCHRVHLPIIEKAS